MWGHSRRGYAPLIALSIFWSHLSAQELGSLRGRVLQKESGSPIAEAAVTLKEIGARARTTVTGSFVLAGVPAGAYTLTVVAIGQTPYEARIAVIAGQPTDVNVEMTANPVTLSGVVVTASKTATEVRDVPAAVSVLTAAQIKQSG